MPVTSHLCSHPYLSSLLVLFYFVVS